MSRQNQCFFCNEGSIVYSLPSGNSDALGNWHGDGYKDPPGLGALMTDASQTRSAVHNKTNIPFTLAIIRSGVF